jgi:ornithine cyclodeaminase/alanine dehydrogenase-like protein (mu-crystallin family)
VFITTGSGVMDVVTAQRIYENAVKHGIGELIEF